MAFCRLHLIHNFGFRCNFRGNSCTIDSITHMDSPDDFHSPNPIVNNFQVTKMNCHCGKKLRRKLGSENAFTCSCGCVYRLVVARKSEKCSEIEFEKRKK